MMFLRRSTRLAALAAVLMCVTSVAVTAQASRLATGYGGYVGVNQQQKVFFFHAHEHANGDVHGSCVVFEPASNGYVRMQITSSTTAGGTLFLAGPITHAVNAPPNFAVGATGMFGVKDNGGWGGPVDEFVNLSAAPLVLGNLTAEQIIMMIGLPPAFAYAPLNFGNVRIF